MRKKKIQVLLKGGCSTIGTDTLFYTTTSPLYSSQPSLCIGNSLDAAKHRFSNCFPGIFSQHSGGSFLTLRRHPGGGGGGESVIFIQLHIWSRQLLGFSMHIVRNLSAPSNLPQNHVVPRGPHSAILLFPPCSSASSSTSIAPTAVAASESGLIGREGATAPSLWRGGGGGDLYPLAVCFASFFLGKADYAVCGPRQLERLATP